MRLSRYGLALLLVTAGASGAAVGARSQSSPAYPPLQVLLSTTSSVIGQPIGYPSGPAKVTAAIVALEPGQTTGRHRHDVPLFAHILEGELTVDHGADGERTFRAGDVVIEALRTDHDGRNTGATPMRLLTVLMGADDIPNTMVAAQ